MYAPNLGEHKYINQLTINIKKLIDNNTIIVGDFLTSHVQEWTEDLSKKSTRKQ